MEHTRLLPGDGLRLPDQLGILSGRECDRSAARASDRREPGRLSAARDARFKLSSLGRADQSW